MILTREVIRGALQRVILEFIISGGRYGVFALFMMVSIPGAWKMKAYCCFSKHINILLQLRTIITLAVRDSHSELMKKR